MQHYEGLDSLKGIAILGVVMVHWGSYLQTSNGILQSFINTGAKGVEIFLIIAVFFACNSYSRWKSNENFGGGGQWIVKRLIRLLPLFYLVCSVAVFIGGTDQGRYYLVGKGISTGNVIAHILLVYGFNPYWINSILGVEWYLFSVLLIYVFVPIIVNKIGSLKLAVDLWMISLPITIILNILLKVFDPLNDPNIWLNFIGGLNIIGHIPAIFSGVVLYRFVQENPMRIEKRLSNSLLIGTMTLLLLLMFGNIKYGTLFWDVLGGFIVFSQILWNNKVIGNPIFCSLGKRSYEIYLIHILLIQWLKVVPQILNNAFFDWILKFVALMITSWMIGCVYHQAEIGVQNRIKCRYRAS